MSTRDELKREQRQFAVWIGFAAGAHVALVAMMVLLNIYYIRTHPPLKVVTVSMVSLPGSPGPAGGAPAPAPPTAPKPAPETPAPKAPEPPAPKKIPEPAVAKKIPEPAVAKKSVPADNAKSQKVSIDEALAKLRKETEKKQPASGIGSAIASLQKKVSAQGGGPASGSGTGGGGGLYGSGGGAVDPYKSKIAGIIQENWQFSQQLVRNAKGMEVYVAICILPNGTISQIRYDRRAPSEYLNNSVNAALKKSSPLPALPGELGNRSLWVGFVFTPEGVSQ